MALERPQASLQTAELCLQAGWVNSAVSRAYYAMFQAAAEEERLEHALAERSAEIFTQTGLYIPCAVLDVTAR
jgi:hypothetical protein